METGFVGQVRPDHPTAWLFWIILGFTLLAGIFLHQRRAALLGWYSDLWKPRAGQDRTYSTGFVVWNWALGALAAGLFSVPLVETRVELPEIAWSGAWTVVFGLGWLLFFGMQYVLHTLSGALLLQQTAFAGYWTERSVGLRWSGLIALPLLWGWLAPGGHGFAAQLFFALSIGLYAVGIVRGTRYLLHKSSLSRVHLFAYLCTLEGAPLAWAFYGATHL
jgi:hypothetical protein